WLVPTPNLCPQSVPASNLCPPQPVPLPPNLYPPGLSLWIPCRGSSCTQELPQVCGRWGLGQAWQPLPCQAGSSAVLSSLPLPQDSAFMVRQSSGQGWNQPFTLAVLYKGHVYNIPIRYVESSRQYALGKDGKSHEERFDSVASIIQHYREHPLVLIEGSSASRAHTCLLFPVKP
uniref:SH2 domain-containing protein n=1 Tax=Chelonoidis abingdonii TaxID=106734 RepID=A0A8C0GZ65_CHEAB